MSGNSRKGSSGGHIKRAKPVASKAGVTRNPKRRYSGGGKVRK